MGPFYLAKRASSTVSAARRNGNFEAVNYEATNFAVATLVNGKNHNLLKPQGNPGREPDSLSK